MALFVSKNSFFVCEKKRLGQVNEIFFQNACHFLLHPVLFCHQKPCIGLSFLLPGIASVSHSKFMSARQFASGYWPRKFR
jgi:hypothetical protein